jgi:threonine/homoserine/homoserine lactone efflux protein
VTELSTYLAFLAAVLAMQLAPGPETLLVLSRGLGEGRRVALATVLGMTLVAGMIQLPLLALGVASAAQSSPLAFEILRWIGAAYLICLGARRLLAPAALAAELRRPSVHSGVSAVRDGVVANLTNPTPLLFMLSFLPQFVEPARGEVALQLVILGATQKATGFAVLGSTALAAGTARVWLARRARFVRCQERLAGAVMIALGLRLLLAGVHGGRS